MYINKINGLEVYESCEDLLKKGVEVIYEYGDNYYIRTKLDDRFDDRVWVVDKKTKSKISNISVVDLFRFVDEATPVSADVLRSNRRVPAVKKKGN